MTEAVLCADIGTTSLKAGLVTADGEVVAVCGVKFNSADDTYHIARQWLPAFCRAVQKLSRICAGKSDVRIAAASISGNGPTVVTEDGTTVLWNDSQLPRDYAGPSLFIPKLIALRSLFPNEFGASKKIFSGPEYLIWQLTGSAITILPESRFESAYWSGSALTKAEIPPEKLPAFCKITQKCGEIPADFFTGHEIPSKVGKISGSLSFDFPLPVFGAGPDFVAALIGTNTLAAGRLCDRSGSSEGLNFCVPSRILADGLRTLPSVIPGLWNISALIPDSGRMPENQRIEMLSRAVRQLRQIAQENRFEFPAEMLVTGGQTKNPGYMRRKSLALGIALVEANCDDAELLGDACAAYCGLGKFRGLQEAASSIVREGKKYEIL